MVRMVFVVLVLAGCGEPDVDNPDCPMLKSFTLNGHERVGSCGPGAFPDVASVQRIADTYLLSFKSVPGTCRSVINGCNLRASCDWNLDGVEFHSEYDYNFSKTGFSGSESILIPSLQCSSIYDETGLPK